MRGLALAAAAKFVEKGWSLMRIRTKPWARPELAACPYFIKEPEALRGRWREIFSREAPLHLDLGCGKCTFLAALAHGNPGINYLGVDISTDILGVARRNIAARYGEQPVENAALCAYNIERIASLFAPEDRVERIYINFCNPWPNAGHHKRRLTHTRQLEAYKAFLSPEGEIWFKTDDDGLFLASLRYFAQAGFTVYEKTLDLNALPDTGNILSEHEVLFESRGIKTKALKARRNAG